MPDQTLYLVRGHLVGQLPDDADSLFGHQLLQVSLQEDSVVVTHVRLPPCSLTPRPVGLETNLSSPRVIIRARGGGVAVEHLVQRRDGFQGRVLTGGCWLTRKLAG